ncbi:hypothetical protein C900_03260 [Fulvivirga imtechensis AK7]|uniref:HNH domain-containing protein n=1 Tax=Fulvivirga imtechensis AK7 TaxID=1237149 RepID=L8JPS5_9BACT|nr:hypothetical protein C900_03260 [Fulvivirga imtechensis AK7]
MNGGTVEQQATYNSFDNALNDIGLLGTSNDNRPAAYLNYILFDEHMQFYQHGHVQIGTAANGAHEKLMLQDIVAEKAGFVYVYISSESAATYWVYFDDMKVTLNESPVVQEDDYYPFGLTFNSYQRVTAKENRFLYNGFELQKSLDWGVYDYQARYYNPEIGRFLNVDPAADLMRRHSPYNYAFDNPIRFIDPDGMVPNDNVTDPKPKKVEDLNVAEKVALVYFILMDKLGAALNESEGNEGSSFGENLQRSSEFITETTLEVQGAREMTNASLSSKSSKNTKTVAKVVNTVDDKVDDAGKVYSKSQGTFGGERAGKKFTSSGRTEISKENVSKYGVEKCENCNVELVPGTQSQKGVSPVSNERRYDHIYPMSKGGDGAASNGQLLCMPCNAKKSDNLPVVKPLREQLLPRN